MLGHHGVDLRLETGTQGHQLGSVADQLPQLPDLGWGDPGLGQLVHPQPVSQLRRVEFIVLDPTVLPVEPVGMGQVDVGALSLEEIDQPVPP